MLKLSLLAIVAAVSFSPTAIAGSVQIQSFGDGPVAGTATKPAPPSSQHHQVVMLDVTQPSAERGFTASGPLPDQALANAFSGLGMATQEERKNALAQGRGVLRSAVPSWMRHTYPARAGGGSRFFSSQHRLALSQNFSAVPALSLYAGCANPDYRPKGVKVDVEARRARYYSAMVAIACEAGVPVDLFDALLTQESGYNPMAQSPKGAVGMAQLMPGTARMFGVFNVWDPIENMRGGARVLKAHLDEFRRYDLALAAYNAGAGRVRERGAVPRIRETVDYVDAILSDVRRQFERAMY